MPLWLFIMSQLILRFLLDLKYRIFEVFYGYHKWMTPDVSKNSIPTFLHKNYIFLARSFCNNINTTFRTSQITRWNHRLCYFVFSIAALFFTYFYRWNLTVTWCYSQYSHAGAFVIATKFWWNSFDIDRRTPWKIAMSKIQSLFYLCLERR